MWHGCCPFLSQFQTHTWPWSASTLYLGPIHHHPNVPGGLKDINWNWHAREKLLAIGVLHWSLLQGRYCVLLMVVIRTSCFALNTKTESDMTERLSNNRDSMGGCLLEDQLWWLRLSPVAYSCLFIHPRYLSSMEVQEELTLFPFEKQGQ